MKRFRWQLIIIFLTGLVVGALLISEQPAGMDPAATPEPVQGGNYTEAVVGSLQRLNPLLDYHNPADRDIDRLIYSQLIRFDERGNPLPDLARVWGISQDGTVYNVELNENAVWHDGKPVTAQDVVFTIEMLRSDNQVVPADLQEFWDDIEVQALSETALRFSLPEPYAPFLDYLTFGVLPEHLLGDLSFDEMIDASFNLQPVGSGPYRFAGQVAGDEGQLSGIQLEAFADYYGSKPFIEQLIFRFYPDGVSALQAYQEGIVQGINPVTAEILPDVLAEPELAVYTGRRPEMTLVLFNLKETNLPFLQEPGVRQALLAALNRQYVVDRILGGQAIIAEGPIFPGTWAYYDGITPATFDTEKAAVLLDQAEYTLPEGGDVRAKEGIEIRFTLLHPDTDTHRAVAEQIQSDWAKIGVAVELEAVSYQELVENNLEPRAFQAALVDLNLARSPDPDPYPFWDQVQATGGQNYTQWDNRVASEYLEQARVTTDIGERARLYRNFQVLFAQDMPALPLYYPVYTYAVDQQVGGVRMGPLFDTSDRFATVLDWFLLSRASTAGNVQGTAAP